MPSLQLSLTVARRITLAIVLAGIGHPTMADDNHLAYRLLQEGKPAQAAELFSNPAWKGVALYRTDQWWRAAQAFVRANNADSLYNLGNAYVHLGYHALALESYLATLAIDPEHADAQFNADLVRKFLAARDQDKGRAGLTPKAREIDRLDKEEQRKDGTRSDSGDDPGENNTRADNRQNKTRQQEQQSNEQAGSKGGNRNASRQHRQRDAQTDTSVQGQSARQQEKTENHSAGGSRNMRDTNADPTAGKRIRLEQHQATEQWLNGIEDNPAAFLKRRIAQEINRRRAAGTLPEPSEQPW